MCIRDRYTDKAQLLDAVKDANAIIIRSDIIDAEELDAAKVLKIVVRAGAGYDSVDLAAAAAHNVCVMNTPGQNSNACLLYTSLLLLRQIYETIILYSMANVIKLRKGQQPA